MVVACSRWILATVGQEGRKSRLLRKNLSPSRLHGMQTLPNGVRVREGCAICAACIHAATDATTELEGYVRLGAYTHGSPTTGRNMDEQMWRERRHPTPHFGCSRMLWPAKIRTAGGLHEATDPSGTYRTICPAKCVEASSFVAFFHALADLDH